MKRLSQFLAAYAELIEHVHYVPTGMSIGELRAKPGHEAAFQTASATCAGAAGAATGASRRHGHIIMTGGTGAQLALDPVANWSVTLEQPWRLSPQSVSDAVQASIGAARSAAEDASDRERGLAGFIARFVRLPLDVREAVGHGRVLGTAAVGTGVLVQLLVAAVGGAAATFIALGLTAAWRALSG